MTSPEDELATLRERAYGPGADILDDPDALARLHELEAEAKPVVADTQRARGAGCVGDGVCARRGDGRPG